MTRSLGWVGAGCACLCLVAGCTLDAFTLPGFGGFDGVVVAGSLDDVATQTKQALDRLNIFISTGAPDKNTIRIAAQSHSGKRFVLTLKGRKTDHGDETQLSIRWDKDADDAFWAELTAAVQNPKPAPSPYLPSGAAN